MFCRIQFSIPPYHSNVLTVDNDFCIVFAVCFLHTLATLLQLIVDYELFAVPLSEKTKNKCTWYFCYQQHCSCKLSLFCPILTKNWNMLIYLRVDPGNICAWHLPSNTTILLVDYCRFTTICFGLIPGPSSGCITGPHHTAGQPQRTKELTNKH